MTARFEHTDAFRGAVFQSVDLSDAVFRDCDLSRVRITASAIPELRVSGHAGEIDRFVVNDVDVTAFVRDELDRRHPERVQLRAVRTPDDYRSMWTVLERLWEDAVARAERLPEAVRNERVDGEWSFAETMRHLVFATDIWVGRMARGEARPFHRIGLPTSDFPADAAREIGVDVDARPSWDEIVEVRAGRAAMMRDAVEGLTETEFERLVTAEPAPTWGVLSLPVGRCLRVVLNEHCEHRHYALRDLATLESR
ncbi:DinB family protein [Glycomyces harbinensis]|uniref:DinB superfamily protein n=1 Tax=Glycomyces harbinensis TaxID=58114 RepID=A0A1G6ZIK7_9ACTN|nr:DinB family protein [Glycomyces harbinensis]SDE02438.1 DinB superfamily protein [Glycomyces harbinensis]